jgi:hypothetical protein
LKPKESGLPSQSLLEIEPTLFEMMVLLTFKLLPIEVSRPPPFDALLSAMVTLLTVTLPLSFSRPPPVDGKERLPSAVFPLIVLLRIVCFCPSTKTPPPLAATEGPMIAALPLIALSCTVATPSENRPAP